MTGDAKPGGTMAFFLVGFTYVSLTSVDIRHSVAYTGGAIAFTTDSDKTINHQISIQSLICINNTAVESGGCLFSSSYWTFIFSSIFSRNNAGYGGAIQSTRVKVSSSRFETNTASFGGGAIALFLPDNRMALLDAGAVSQSVFLSNVANKGGAFYVVGGYVILLDTDVSHNQAAYGAGLFADGGQAAGSAAATQLYTVTLQGFQRWSRNLALLYGGAAFVT